MDFNIILILKYLFFTAVIFGTGVVMGYFLDEKE